MPTATTKKLIERSLPFSNKYIYLGITRGNIIDAQFCTCDNCGKLITNMVQIADLETKKRYTIGVDCTETLVKAQCLYNNGSLTDYRQDIYEYNKAAKFVTEINAGCTFEYNGMLCTITNRKGKIITECTHSLKKFFPEIFK